MTFRLPRTGGIMLLALVLSGCAYQAGDLDDPVRRKFTWFSFLDAADLRRDCAPGAADRYRMVYNADYSRQVRIYELGIGGNERLLREHVIEPAQLLRLDPRDPLEPWRGEAATRLLSPSDHARLIESLAESGAFSPPPVGLRLPSRRHYWIVAACRDGRFRYHAWLNPSESFRSLTFDDVLARLGPANIPFVPAPLYPPAELHDPDEQARDFIVEVGTEGLRGI